MSVLENIAAIAKGMSITFREMFQPTVVENYPDGPGPLRGAMVQDCVLGDDVWVEEAASVSEGAIISKGQGHEDDH